MISLETACERIRDYYLHCGYPGIGNIGDVGDEWVFIQAPETKGGGLPVGDHPIFVNKSTGEHRRMVFDVPDLLLLNSAQPITVPTRFRAAY